ncbi:MAG TPA: hypothetical protein DCS55_21950, partial [Acidimicrobiaceae bacterium]|nr:hypothetical protein [Acidimicrobiaceae bacterium]
MGSAAHVSLRWELALFLATVWADPAGSGVAPIVGVEGVRVGYEPLPIREVGLDKLRLDLDNYRIPTHRDDET